MSGEGQPESFALATPNALFALRRVLIRTVPCALPPPPAILAPLHPHKKTQASALSFLSSACSEAEPVTEVYYLASYPPKVWTDGKVRRQALCCAGWASGRACPPTATCPSSLSRAALKTPVQPQLGSGCFCCPLLRRAPDLFHPVLSLTAGTPTPHLPAPLQGFECVCPEVKCPAEEECPAEEPVVEEEPAALPVPTPIIIIKKKKVKPPAPEPPAPKPKPTAAEAEAAAEASAEASGASAAAKAQAAAKAAAGSAAEAEASASAAASSSGGASSAEAQAAAAAAANAKKVCSRLAGMRVPMLHLPCTHQQAPPVLPALPGQR